MKKILLFLSMALVLFACNEKDNTVKMDDEGAYVASIENFEDYSTKTLLSGLNVVWHADDAIAIFEKSTLASKFQLDANFAGSTNGSFLPVSSQGGGYVSGNEIPYDNNLAVYPYEDDLVCNVAEVEGENALSYTVQNVTVPTEQSYTENSFATNSYVMAAVTKSSTDKQLKFKNVCGVLRLQLTGTSVVKSIKLEGNSGEKLSGNASVTVYTNDDAPVIAMNDNASEYVVLDCGEGVQLNETVVTNFYITLAPTSFQSGFKVTVTDVDGAVDEIATTKANAVNRSRVLKMPEVAVEPNTVINYQAPNQVSVNIANIVEHTYDPTTRKGKIIFQGKLTTIPAGAFVKTAGGYNIFDNITIPEGVEIIGSSAFQQCVIGSISFPSTLREIGGQAFFGCDFGTYPFTQFPTESPLTIGYEAFSVNGDFDLNNESQDIIIPENVVSVGISAFAGRNIKSITIKCQTINLDSFQYLTPTVVNSYAEYMNLSSTLTSVVQVARLRLFCYKVKNLHRVWVASTTEMLYLDMAEPPTTNLTSAHNASFNIQVPSQYKDAYRAVAPWNQYNSIMN